MTVSRQVLAEPEAGPDRKTWARLADGTPLVTAARRGKGLIVLFHVTADTTWSNLPLSGLFVDMLRRVVARAGAPAPSLTPKPGGGDRTRPARPGARSTALARSAPRLPQAEPIAADFAGLGDAGHPPGFYGSAERSESGQRALAPGAALAPGRLSARSRCRGRPRRRPADRAASRGCCSPPSSASTIDALVSAVAGRAARLRRPGARGAVAGRLRWSAPSSLRSAAPRAEFPAASAARHGRGAYDPPRLCRDRRRDGRRDLASRGLIDMTRVLARAHIRGARRARSPSIPRATNSRFYPLHLLADRRRAAAAAAGSARARLAAYMKNGGTVVFDTRDALTQRPGGAPTPEACGCARCLRGSTCRNSSRCRATTSLTKTFYLLDRIVGRTDDRPDLDRGAAAARSE